MLTSDAPEPSCMLSSTSTQPTAARQTYPTMPVSPIPFEVELMKFAIGLRILDEKKRARVLAFMATLKERKEDTPHGL